MMTTLPKVAVVVHETLYGGGSRQAFYILKQLCQLGYPVCLLSNARQTWLGQKLRQHALPLKAYFSSWIQRDLHPIKDILALFWMIRVLWYERPDVLIVSGTKLMGLATVAGLVIKTPKITAIVRGQGASQHSKFLPWIYRMERWMVQRGVRLVTVCEYNRQELLARQVGLPQQIITIHNGTDLEAIQPGHSEPLRAMWGIPQDAVVFAMIGRLSLKQKRYDAFIRLAVMLCSQYPQAYFLLVGEGEDRSALQQQIDTSGYANRIQITGFIADMTTIYSIIDVSVLLTHYEGLPNALLESAAAGLPMLVEDVCGNTEVVQHQHNGLVVSPGNEAQLYESALLLMTQPELRQRYGAQARILAEQRFDVECQVKRLIAHACA